MEWVCGRDLLCIKSNMSVCLFVCLSAYLHVNMFVCMSCRVGGGGNCMFFCEYTFIT